MKKVISNAVSICCWILLVNVSADGQANQWAWMKGDTTALRKSVYGTKGIANANNKPGTRSGVIKWKDQAGNFWLFGGSGEDGPSSFGKQNDLWKYDVQTNEWAWINGDTTYNNYGVYGSMGIAAATNKPGARAYGTSWTDMGGNLWLFGGDGYLAQFSGRLNDLWKYNIVTNEWTWMKGDSVRINPPYYGIQGVPSDYNVPGLRYGSAGWADTLGNLWMFGGYGYISPSNSPGNLNDLWRYKIATNQWTWMKGDNTLDHFGVYGIKGVEDAANKPGSKSTTISWTDAQNNLWLFGGGGYMANNLGYGNDVWKYNIATNAWTWVNGDSMPDVKGFYGVQNVSSASNQPGARQACAYDVDANKTLWIHGGVGYAKGSPTGKLNDLWKYNSIANEWTWVNGDSAIDVLGKYGQQGIAAPANKPGARGVSAGWVDNNGDFWLFGGTGFTSISGSSVLNDLWKFTTGTVFPVHLLGFSGVLKNQNVLLKWTIENEQNFDRYEIEKSPGSKDFVPIGFVKPGEKVYEFLDKAAASLANGQSLEAGHVIFYRLKLKDRNGAFRYSKTISIRLPLANSFSMFPNPAHGGFQLLPYGNMKGKIQIEVADMAGKIVLQKNAEANGSAIFIAVEKLSAGTYVVKLKNRNEVQTMPLIIE